MLSINFSCEEPHQNIASEEDEPHRLCASDFCSKDGSYELIALLNDTSPQKPIQIDIQFINTTSSENLIIQTQNIETKLNSIFKEAKINFIVNPNVYYLASTYSIDTIYNNIEIKNELISQKKFNKNNRINIYIVPKGKSLNGYTNVLTENFSNYKKTSLNYIFINEKALSNNSTLLHELGHFFGLQHTFGKSPLELSTDEKPDGSNCISAGDFICDTPSDPNGKIDENCNFLGLKNGLSYLVTPDVYNFMSYYPSKCKMRFSNTQLKLMHNFTKEYRYYLIKK
jgi:hypothetical protein